MLTVQGDSVDATSETVQGVKTMNTGEKIDYMIQCLKVAKAEYEYSVDYLTNEPERDDESIWEYLTRHRQPNKALIRDNLRNVARMGFQVANEVK